MVKVVADRPCAFLLIALQLELAFWKELPAHRARRAVPSDLAVDLRTDGSFDVTLPCEHPCCTSFMVKMIETVFELHYVDLGSSELNGLSLFPLLFGYFEQVVVELSSADGTDLLVLAVLVVLPLFGDDLIQLVNRDLDPFCELCNLCIVLCEWLGLPVKARG